MKSNNNSSATLTEKRIASAKGLHLICAIVAMVLNIISFVVLAINVSISEITFLVFPLALAVLDIVFLVKVILSNYRFAYAINGAIIHSALVLVISAVAYVVMGVLRANEGIVFVNFALYAMIIVHVIQSVATIVTALCATKGGKSFRKILGLVLTLVFVACAGIYGRMLLTDGFFGQGGYTDYRTVVYKYNEDGTYTAVDVLDGYGTNVVIPHQFNGSHVSFIDCALFAHEELTSVKVDCDHKSGCDHELGFVGEEHLNFINEELQLLAPKSYMDKFRKALYTFAIDDGNVYAANALKLANHVYPDDIAENQVYISFGYDAATLKLVGVENVIPVWVKEKGATFNATDLTDGYADGVNYLINSNVDDPKNLKWCHENLDEKIFKCITDDEGNEISGAISESVINANVVFENLYHLRIVDDADETKWNLDNTLKYMYSADSTSPVCEYIITTVGKLQSKLDAITRRNGFTLKFKTGTEASKRDLESIADEIARLDAAGSRDLYVFLDWTLLPPTINSVTADGKSEGHKAVYGSNVKLASAATSPDSKIAILYEWYYNGEVIAAGSEHTLENLYPNSATFANTFTKAGTYTLRVTAGNDEVTSLSSYVEKTVEVGFEKKNINFVWVLPEGNDTVYSATNKNSIITGIDGIGGTTYMQDDLVHAEDVITFNFLIETETGKTAMSETNPVRNAGDYALVLELTGTAAELYRIDEADEKTSLTIKPYPVNVQWGLQTEFVYDGQLHNPTAIVTPLGNDSVTVDVSGAEKNYNKAGYTAVASTTNTNYELLGTEMAFKITKRLVSVTSSSWDKNTFVYNSAMQRPDIKNVGNVVEGEVIFGDITYTGEYTNVGSYIVTATLPDVYNYAFENNVEYAYTITPRPLTVTITDKTTVYSGKVYDAFTFTSDGVQVNDKIEEILDLNYSNSAAAIAVNVNSDGYVISADIEPAEKYENYAVNIKNGTLKITKKALKIAIDNYTKTYDALEFTAADASATVEGLVETDREYEVFTLNYKGTAINAKNYNVSGYEINADIVPQEKYGNYEITLTKATLKINKAPLIITAVGNQKIYDGKPALAAELSFQAEGLVGGETSDMLGEPKYSGAALSATYVVRGTDGSIMGHKFSVAFAANAVTNNYSITYNQGEYIINPKDLTVTVKYGTKIYDGYVPNKSTYFSFEATGFVNGETVINLGTPTYAGEATTSKNAGTYDLMITSFSNTSCTRNYDITYVPGTFVIEPKSITITVQSLSTVYNGKTYAFSVNNYTIDGLAGTDKKTDFEPIFSGDAVTAKNVGTYTLGVTLTGLDNYSPTYIDNGEGTYTITQKALTISVVSSSKTYDGTLTGTNAFSVKANGLVAGETVDMLGELTYGGSAVGSKNAKQYDLTVVIEPSDLTVEGKNYAIKYEPGTFTINKKSITVTAIGGTMQYTGAVNTNTSLYSASADGMITGEYLTDLGTLVYGGAATENKNVGYHTLTVRVTEPTSAADNYTIFYVDGIFEITKAPLTITVTANDRVYDATANNVYSVDIPVLLGEDTKSGLGTLVYGNATSAKNVGKYTLTVSIPNPTTMGKNYDIKFVADDFEITKAPLTVTVVANDKVYNGMPNTFGVTPGTLATGDTLAKLGKLTYIGSGVDAVNVGDYKVEVTINDSDLTTIGRNYEITFVGDTFSITKKNLTITVNASNKTYDGMPNTFDVTHSALATGDTLAELGELTYIDADADGIDALTAVNVGTYKVAVTINEADLTEKGKNYNITFNPKTFSITKRKITVTAAATDRVYDGTSNNAFSASASNLLDGDKLADLGKLVYSGTAVGAVNAGKYTLYVKVEAETAEQTAKLANYDIAYASDTSFVISPREVSVTPISITREYNGTVGGAFDFTIDGVTDLAEIEIIKAALGKPTYGGSAMQAKDAGEYVITVAFEAPSANYAVTCGTGKLVITAPVTEGTTSTTATTTPVA